MSYNHPTLHKIKLFRLQSFQITEEITIIRVVSEPTAGRHVYHPTQVPAMVCRYAPIMMLKQTVRVSLTRLRAQMGEAHYKNLSHPLRPKFMVIGFPVFRPSKFYCLEIRVGTLIAMFWTADACRFGQSMGIAYHIFDAHITITHFKFLMQQ